MTFYGSNVSLSLASIQATIDYHGLTELIHENLLGLNTGDLLYVIKKSSRSLASTGREHLRWRENAESCCLHEKVEYDL